MSNQRLSPTRETDASLALLYATERANVRRTLRRKGVAPADIEDLVHEVFLRANRAVGVDVGWLCVAARFFACHYRRRKFRYYEILDTDFVEQYPAPPEDRVDRVAVRRALGRMDAGERMLLRMHQVEGMSLREIGDALGKPKTTMALKATQARHTFCSYYGA